MFVSCHLLILSTLVSNTIFMKIVPHKKCIYYKIHVYTLIFANKSYVNTSLAAKGALTNRLQRLQNPKWPPGGPKMAEGVWKGVHPQVFGCSKQLSPNKFFYPSTPCMRKGRDGEKREKRKRLMIIVAR